MRPKARGRWRRHAATREALSTIQKSYRDSSSPWLVPFSSAGFSTASYPRQPVPVPLEGGSPQAQGGAGARPHLHARRRSAPLGSRATEHSGWADAPPRQSRTSHPCRCRADPEHALPLPAPLTAGRSPRPGLRNGLAATRQRGLQRRAKGREIVGAVVPLAIDEEGWRPIHAAAHSAQEMLAHQLGVRMRREIQLEAADVEADYRGVLSEVDVVEGVLVREEHVMHLPELALRARRFGGLRSRFRTRMHLR